MSSTSRNQQRRQRARAARAIAANRKKAGSSVHYLTLATRPSKCETCGGTFRAGREIVYRAEPRELLCVARANGAGLKPRPSARWTKARQ